MFLFRLGLRTFQLDTLYKLFLTFAASVRFVFLLYTFYILTHSLYLATGQLDKQDILFFLY